MRVWRAVIKDEEVAVNRKPWPNGDDSRWEFELSSTIKDSHRHAIKRSWESMRVGSGSCIISRNARAIASRDVNKLCCARVPVLLPSSFWIYDWHSSVHTEEMGLSDELVYCFYRLSTRLTEVEQGSQINSCVVKIYLRMLIFMHEIYQQSCNYTDSRQILKEIELCWATWFEILFPATADRKTLIDSHKNFEHVQSRW